MKRFLFIFAGFFCFCLLAATTNRDGWGDSRGIPVSGNDSLEVVIDSLIGVARTYIGTPYKYGARGPERFDCSGYTSYVFNTAEVALPFSSRAQIHRGLPVSLDSVRKGDLIFFTSPRSGSNPGHVGIITRNDEDGLYFIHSSSTRGVVEDRLDGYYRNRYLGARRILD